MDETNISQAPAPKSSNTILVIGGLILVALVGLGALAFRMTQHTTSGPADESNISPSENTAVVPVNPSTLDSTDSSLSGDTAEVVIVDVEAGSFYYKPNEIRVKKGDKVKITMTSADMMHDFNIDALNVKLPVTQSGKTASVEFTVDEVGEFEFYCSVGNHRKMGQVGKLIVE